MGNRLFEIQKLWIFTRNTYMYNDFFTLIVFFLNWFCFLFVFILTKLICELFIEYHIIESAQLRCYLWLFTLIIFVFTECYTEHHPGPGTVQDHPHPSLPPRPDPPHSGGGHRQVNINTQVKSERHRQTLVRISWVSSFTSRWWTQTGKYQNSGKMRETQTNACPYSLGQILHIQEVDTDR